MPQAQVYKPNAWPRICPHAGRAYVSQAFHQDSIPNSEYFIRQTLSGSVKGFQMLAVSI